MPAKSIEKSVFRNEVEKLEQVRDELRVQAHLFKADVKKEFHELEKKLQKVKRDARLNARVTKRVAGESAEEVSDVTRMLFDTVKEGMTRIRKSLKTK